ncbi:DUF4179 domain-containing protein [Neobacillus sp. D3-1R]|uniref:DUF4179 domain-containing protein n=1 Tax=Neobacillus sp. D3-1R TaxID=3445778 RepID=UPI003F9FA374
MLKVDHLLKRENEESLQNIEVPSSLYSFAEKVPEIFKQEYQTITKKPVNKRWEKKAISWAAAAAIITFAVGLSSDVIANYFENVPFIKMEKQEGFKENFSNMLHAAKNEQFTSIGQTVEDHGIKMVITDAIYDGSQVALSFSFQTNKEMNHVSSSKMKLLFNGDKESWSSIQDFSKVNQNEYTGAMKIWVPDTKVNKEKLNVELQFSEVLGTQGKWNFDLNLNKVGQTFTTGSSLPLQDMDLRIDKVMFTPLKVEVTSTGNDVKNVIINLKTPEGVNLAAIDSFEKEKEKRFQYQPINSIPQSVILEVTKGGTTKTVILPLSK